MADQVREGKVLWMWKNFVGGKPEYWAFDNPYPCVSVHGDPLTLGEPCGYAVMKESVNGRPDRSEDEVMAGVIKRAATASHAADVEALTKAAQRLCRSFPTDDDMAAAGWGRAEIDEACNAYDALRAALKGDKP